MNQNIVGVNGIHVFGGHTSSPWVDGGYQDMTPGNNGDLKILGNTVHVWTNGRWNPVSNTSTTIELTPEIQSLLSWAREHRRREEELMALSDKYNAVRNAKAQLIQAQEQLEVVVALCDSREFKA